MKRSPPSQDRPIRDDDPANRSMLVVGRDLRSPGRTRTWLEAFLRDHVPSEQIADACLIASELVTNALRHGLGEVVVRASFDDEAVQLSVTDSGDDRPTLQQPDPTRVGGVGLQIVDQLATAWGTAAFPGGKTVWASIARSPA